MTGVLTASHDESRLVISIIVPVRNEASFATALAGQLGILAASGCEVIVVDGDSEDGTASYLRAQGIEVITSAAGRAVQMNAGARHATGTVLLFLHADTELPVDALEAVRNALHASRPGWGRFDVRIAGHSRWLPIVAFMINSRSRLTGIATGDQAIFVDRLVFERLGGFPEQPLMEDVELSRRLLHTRGRPVCLRLRVTTSGRRWDTRGAWPTILLMWRLRWAYWRGVPASTLEEMYR